MNANTSAGAALTKMAEIINHEGWNHLHDELGSTPPTHLTDDAIDRFQRVEIRIRTDDIPKNEEKFRRLLQENVISDFNTFRTSLENMEQTIITRIGLINLHLAKVDYDRREGLRRDGARRQVQLAVHHRCDDGSDRSDRDLDEPGQGRHRRRVQHLGDGVLQ